MIFIVVKQPVREKYADEFPTLVEEFTSASRAEPGCLFFDWYRSVEEPNVYILTEGFRDAAAGEAHVQSEHFKNAGAQMSRWLAAVPEIVHVETPDEGWSVFT